MLKLKLNPNVTKNVLKENNFKETEPNYFTYRFPVYKYNGTNNKQPLLYCLLCVDLESSNIEKMVVNDDNTPYSTYNNTSGTSFVKKINNKISNELKKLRMQGILV